MQRASCWTGAARHSLVELLTAVWIVAATVHSFFAAAFGFLAGAAVFGATFDFLAAGASDGPSFLFFLAAFLFLGGMLLVCVHARLSLRSGRATK